MKKQLLASIITSSYNYGRFLKDCIDSALNQTYPHTEVIVVDDASTDDSQEIMAGYGDRIIPVLREKNEGAKSTCNAACRLRPRLGAGSIRQASRLRAGCGGYFKVYGAAHCFSRSISRRRAIRGRRVCKGCY